MSQHSPQIFHTTNPSRWQRIKWSSRIVLVIAAVMFVFFGIAVATLTNSELNISGKATKKLLTDTSKLYTSSALEKKYKGFRKFIDDKWAKNSRLGRYDNNNPITDSLFGDSVGIRAAFYVAWDPQSFYSLKRNIGKTNLVLPEWFFIDGKADTLITNIDKKAYDIIKAAKVKVMPLLSNNFNGKFSGDALHRIFTNKAKQDKLIDDVIKQLERFKFTGINVDFEELKEDKNENLSGFQKNLYERLHAKGFLVTQNVSPFNDDYNYKELSKYNDYIFLMAYDEHNESTKPGPVSSQKWIEAAVAELATHVPTGKIILNMAAYGYDWDQKGHVTDLTYQQALVTARESEEIINFDNNTYNLNYKYYDSNDSIHEVHFVDAATNFNTLRFATEYGLAGTAVWRLGAEDARLWNFYNLPMTKQALNNYDFSKMQVVNSIGDVDYIGEGEILDLAATPSPGHISTEIDNEEWLITEETYDKLPSSYVIRKLGKTSAKKLVLTYDDGPDPVYTKQILDTLAYYKVPATFFVVGFMAENNIPLVKRILREGHEIGNHTFTHPDMSKVSKQRALLEMNATQLLIECITGRSTIMFRAPFNADSEPGSDAELVPVALSRTQNYLTIGESLDPEDWEKNDRPDFNADTILNRIIAAYNFHLSNGDSANIILLHDAGGDRTETVKATGMIIRHFKKMGYTFTTVADLMHKTPNEVMPPVAKGSGYYLIQISALLFEVGYWISNLFFTLFMTFVVLSAIRLLVLAILAVLQKRKEKGLQQLANTIPNTPAQEWPLVSIIVPAYNEEVNAVSSLQNLFRCTYPNFNIVFVDDGSKDNTFAKVSEAFAQHSGIQLLTKPNGGKASALNYGIAHTAAQYVVCIDADTKLVPNAVSMLMENFFAPTKGKPIGAVAGAVKVGNTINLLTNWQNIEYITSQNFDRKGFAYANAITVVPGAIGAFSKEAIVQAGGFTSDTLAEDCDITIRILRAGYHIANEPRALAFTEAPETLKQFLKQRKRWSFGVMQTFWKHRDTLFNQQYGSLGWVAMPDILLFKYIIPLFAPLADALMLVGLLTDSRGLILQYYLLFTLVDVVIAALSFVFEKENLMKLFWLLPQRIVYRWLMMLVLFQSLRRAIKGELQHWGVLKRTGNVKDITVAEA